MGRIVFPQTVFEHAGSAGDLPAMLVRRKRRILAGSDEM